MNRLGPSAPDEGDIFRGWTFREGNWTLYIGETLVVTPFLLEWHLGLARAGIDGIPH